MKAIVPGYSRGRKDYTSFLKECVLFYETIEMPSTEKSIQQASRFNDESIAADIQFCIDKRFCSSITEGILVRALRHDAVKNYEIKYEDLSDARTAIGKGGVFWSRLRGQTDGGYSDIDVYYQEAMESVQQELLPEYARELETATARSCSLEIQELVDRDDIYLFDQRLVLSDRFQKKKASVYKVIFENVTLPKREVPLEELFDFKQEHKLYLMKLRKWVKQLSSDELKLYEIRDEVEYMLTCYDAAMEKAKWKGATGVLEFIVVSTAEFIENAVKLKLKKMAELPFKIVNYRQELLEREAEFDGAQLAYLHKIRHL
jgi:hypothetical protein